MSVSINSFKYDPKILNQYQQVKNKIKEVASAHAEVAEQKGDETILTCNLQEDGGSGFEWEPIPGTRGGRDIKYHFTETIIAGSHFDNNANTNDVIAVEANKEREDGVKQKFEAVYVEQKIDGKPVVFFERKRDGEVIYRGFADTSSDYDENNVWIIAK
ncbi:MAG: hypothetical protein ABRQ38_17395 [Candidatus Eremiobacterota bacterium]